MKIDRNQAREAFLSYVSAFDPENPRIALKIDHTLRVADLCADIAEATGEGNPNLEGTDVDIAYLMGLLHDIGRFEQVRQFDTFNDSISVPHAKLSAEVLFDGYNGMPPIINTFADVQGEEELLRTAIVSHSDFRVDESVDERTRLFADILRDADKIDIIKVNCICPIQDIYGVTDEEMYSSDISDTIEAAFYEHRTIERGIRKTPADILISHICFAWELVFKHSREIAFEQGYLTDMLSRHFRNEDTERRFREMSVHMEKELK